MKTLAFLLACLCLCAVVYVGFSLIYRSASLTGDVSDGLDNSLEALFFPDYPKGNTFAQEVNTVTWTLCEALREGELSPASALYLDERVWYYAGYGPEGDSPSAALSNSEMRTPAQLWAASPYVFFYEDGQLQTWYEGTRWYTGSLVNWPDASSYRTDNATLYIAFQPEYVAARQAEWGALRSTLIPAVWVMVGCLIGALVQIVYLSFVTGRRPGSDTLHLSPLDSIYSDLLLCLLAGFIVAWAAGGFILMEEVAYSSNTGGVAIWFAVILTAICVAGLLALWLSMMRKIKARRFMRHSLIWTVLSGIGRLVLGFFRLIGRFLDALFSGRRFQGYPFALALFRRQTTFIVLSLLMVMGFVIFLQAHAAPLSLLCLLLELAFVYYYVSRNNRTFQDMEKLCSQVFEIYQGNMEFDPHVPDQSPLADTSRQLSGLGAGMEKAMQRQLQSERTKIALVTNVSHDLKTPLTSIIGYIDLLARDEQLSPEARDYVSILASKSQRLKTIIEDLFDLAKTTGGDDSGLTMEVLDLKRLLEQTLADMEDKIERSGQLVRTALPHLPVFARADGRKLYRIIQNIMDNALKYSMKGTRIYVSLSTAGPHARMVFKNTASYEMDFTADEVLERFARGDKSRTTEGSGLGLSIAQGFTRALGGDLKVTVDGDQFRVELTFDTSAPPAPQSESAAQEPSEPLPPGMKERMDLLRGKLYTPRQDVPPILIEPVRYLEPQGHFEPDRPVELSELEGVLEAFDKDRQQSQGPSAVEDDDESQG